MSTTGDSLTRAVVRRASSQLAALVATHEGEQDGDSSAGKEELGATPRPVGVVEGKEEAEPAQHSGAAHALLDPFEPANTPDMSVALADTLNES